MDEVAIRLANHIKRTVTGPMWHGAALGDLLADVTPDQAAARPVRDAHSIWELALHIVAWAEIARARLRGERIADPSPDEDWPPVGPPTADAWSALVEHMRHSHRELAADVRHLTDAQIHAKVTGLDYSVSNLLHGVIEHGTYHGGQIALLRKALGVQGRAS